jgi:hypothetical protein
MSKSGVRQFFSYGLPFLALMVGGSVGLGYVMQSKVARSTKRDLAESLEGSGATIDDDGVQDTTFDLKDEVARMRAELNTTSWENVPIPRDASDPKQAPRKLSEYSASGDGRTKIRQSIK